MVWYQHHTSDDVGMKKNKKKTVIFYLDAEREYCYDKPYKEPGAKLVTQEELVKAQKTQTVILIKEGDHDKDK